MLDCPPNKGKQTHKQTNIQTHKQTRDSDPVGLSERISAAHERARERDPLGQMEKTVRIRSKRDGDNYTHAHARGLMAKAGRKRLQNVQREPNGRPKPEERRFSPTAIKRLLESSIALASDPRLGTEIGRMLLNGDLTTRQAGAGWQWSELTADYFSAIGASSLQVKAISYERGAKAQAPEPDSEAGKAISEKEERIVKRWEKAHLILLSQGMVAESATRRLCEGKGQRAQDYYEVVRVKQALDALAAHFALA